MAELNEKLNAEVAEQEVTVADTETTQQESEYLLEVNNLKKYFVVDKNLLGRPTAYLKAVDNVSFKLKKGKTLGIVGESGCGKTTMGRTILRLYDVTGGDVYFKGKEVSRISERAFDKLRPNMQMIFQDPYASLSPRLSVGEIIGEAALQHKLVDKAHYREYVLKVMKMCGLQPHYYDRYPHEFSGGQRQRICIARALALNPDLVVCDEPVSALDVSIQAQVINMFDELQDKMGLSYLFIAHDLLVVRHISHRIAVMYLGKIVEMADADEIYDHPLHPYSKALISAVPIPDPNIARANQRIPLGGDIPSPLNAPSGCPFRTRCPHATEECAGAMPEFKEVSRGHFVACHHVDKIN